MHLFSQFSTLYVCVALFHVNTIKRDRGGQDILSFKIVVSHRQFMFLKPIVLMLKRAWVIKYIYIFYYLVSYQPANVYMNVPMYFKVFRCKVTSKSKLTFTIYMKSKIYFWSQLTCTKSSKNKMSHKNGSGSPVFISKWWLVAYTTYSMHTICSTICYVHTYHNWYLSKSIIFTI